MELVGSWQRSPTHGGLQCTTMPPIFRPPSGWLQPRFSDCRRPSRHVERPVPTGAIILEPLSEHTLLVFWAQFTVLLAVARGMGYLFRKVGQPAVVGELGAGLLIGPSVFARVLPEQAEWLFPGSAVESAPILTVAWVGVVLLLVETGFETDLGLLRRLGKQAASVSLGSLLVPMALGFGLGWLMPPGLFHGSAATQFTFAAFIAVAMSISALPVVARILTEMGLMRRNIAQVTVAAAMVNDLVGWILLGTLSGIVASGELAVGPSLVTIAAIAIFFAFALTLGQRWTDAALRTSRRRSNGLAGPLTTTILVVLVAATVTQAIGVEAVLGAFVAGMVLGRSPYQHREVRRTIELLSAAVFAPIFFATAGIYVDLGAVASGTGILWAAVVIAVATLTKLAGSYVGARFGAMSHSDGLAIGIGLNARGAMEIVLATIAFAIGVFSQDAYTIVVLMAMATSLMAPPMLRRALRSVTPEGDEAQRLEREEILSKSVIASTSRGLVPTRGGENSRYAAEVLNLVLQPEASLTILTVDHPEDQDGTPIIDEGLESRLEGRSFQQRRVVSTDPATAILDEAQLGYGMVGLGLTEEFRDTHELSDVLQHLLANTRVPLILVRHGNADPDRLTEVRRVLVPVTGVRAGRAAEEVGAVLAARIGADLDLVHVVDRVDRQDGHGPQELVPAGGPGVQSRDTKAPEAAKALADEAVQRASRFGARARGTLRGGSVTPEALLDAGRDLGSEVLVLGAQARTANGRPFLGHGTEYLLEHAPQIVVTVIFPSDDSQEVSH